MGLVKLDQNQRIGRVEAPVELGVTGVCVLFGGTHLLQIQNSNNLTFSPIRKEHFSRPFFDRPRDMLFQSCL